MAKTQPIRTIHARIAIVKDQGEPHLFVYLDDTGQQFGIQLEEKEVEFFTSFGIPKTDVEMSDIN